jgi:aspartate aminotransferase-like enzyme
VPSSKTQGPLPRARLLAPGPTPVPDEVRGALAAPLLHHRGPAFQALLREVQAGLSELFQSRSAPLCLACSGSGAMEASVTNFLSPGDVAIVVEGGKFGERYGEICRAFGVTVETVAVTPGQAVRVEDVEAALGRRPEARAVLMQACETSTGVLHPYESIARRMAGRPGTLMVVDAITAVGASDIRTDEHGLDVVLGASQKALGVPPGLAFVAVSEKAWGHAATARLPRYYFDLRKEHEQQARGQTAFTPATGLLSALREALALWGRAGRSAQLAACERRARATRAAVQALGLSLFAAVPAPALTAVNVPAGIDGSALVAHLRDRYGVQLAGGQGELKGRIVRLAHLGFIDELDTLTAIAALEMGLGDLGHPIAAGAGVAAASAILRAREELRS